MLLFKRHSRLFRLFRIAFYLSLPAGMALLIVSQFTQLSTPQAIAAWALAAAATILMAMPIVAGLTLLPGFSESLASKHRAQPPDFGRSNLGRETTTALRALQRAWNAQIEELSLSVRTSNNIIELLPDPLIILDADRAVSRANKAARSAFGEEILGRNLATIFRAPEVLTAWSEVLEKGSSTQREFTIPLPEPARTFLCRAFPVKLEGQQTRATLIGFYDITTLKDIDQTRADFVANASHEIRTPLAAISGALETLRGPAKDDIEAQERFLDIIQDHAGRINRLIEDLLSLSQIEMMEHNSPSERTNLMSIIKGAIEDIEWRARQTGVTINLEDRAQDIEVAADPHSLRRAFQNLLDNAIKYGGSEVSVKIRLTGSPAKSQTVTVSILDNGAGIPEKHLGRLTERFYRVDKARSRGLGGTGLGLAIVKHIVNRHRGQLSITSKGGKGTAASITVPVLEIQ